MKECRPWFSTASPALHSKLDSQTVGMDTEPLRIKINEAVVAANVRLMGA